MAAIVINVQGGPMQEVNTCPIGKEVSSNKKAQCHNPISPPQKPCRIAVVPWLEKKPREYEDTQTCGRKQQTQSSREPLQAHRQVQVRSLHLP